MHSVTQRNRTILLTGASRGLGESLARALSSEAHTIILAARKKTHLNTIANELAHSTGDGSCEVITVEGDLGSPDGVSCLLSHLNQRIHDVDILINNAGCAVIASLEDTNPEQIIQTAWVNLISPMLLSKAFLPGMRKRQWGRIIHISSISAKNSGPNLAAYTATKAGLNGFSQCLSTEVSAHGITSNVIMPGFMHTDMGKLVIKTIKAQQPGLSDENILNQIKEYIPNKSFTKPADVASLVKYLISDAASNITGATIALAGGL